jgi:hypothetical protein
MSAATYREIAANLKYSPLSRKGAKKNEWVSGGRVIYPWQVSFHTEHFIGCHSRMFLSGISLRAH